MKFTASPDIIVYVCHRSVPPGVLSQRQWRQDEYHIVVRQAPCSGKIDGQYLMHAFEGGACGVCVVTCPKGECHLGQGNYRAEIRIRTIQRLLGEIGLESQRAELIHFSPQDSGEQFDQIINEFVQRICTLGKCRINMQKTLSSG